MEISQHYPAYKEKTLIIVTNNELARIFLAEEREIEEKRVIENPLEKPQERAEGRPNTAPPDLDEMKAHNRDVLYNNLSDTLLDYIKKDVKQIIVCVPEANKNLLLEHMHTDVKEAITDIVPKNLASLEMDQIVRILQETMQH